MHNITFFDGPRSWRGEIRPRLYWLIRLLFWDAEQRRDYRLREKLASHPDLRAIEARIKAAQARYREVEAKGGFEAWERSHDIEMLIDKYEARYQQLAAGQGAAVVFLIARVWS